MMAHRFIRTLALATLAGFAAACGDGGSEPVEGPAPTVSNVSPSTGTVGTELTISGTNFRASATVQVGGIASTTVEVASGTQIFALVPSGIATDQALIVAVRNTDGTEASLPSAFTAVAPSLQFVNSATKPSGNTGSTVILEGAAFGDVQGTGAVRFSDGAGGTVTATIASPEDWTNTFIVTTVPSGAGDGDVVVVTATGTSNGIPFTLTEAATFSPSTINWTETTGLPAAVSGHQAAYVPIDDATGTTQNYVYVTGGTGNDSVPLANVWHAQIQSDGSIASWTQSTNTLPTSRAFHASIAATPFNSRVKGNGYLYALGGLDGVASVTTGVSIAPLGTDGSVGAWSSATALPQPLHSAGAVVFRSAIYVAGGATTGNAPVATVYRARIDTLGLLGAWEQLVALPSARAYHRVVSFGGYLYAVGGESATVHPHDPNQTNNDTKLSEVAFIRINLRNGDLVGTAWTINESSLQKNRNKHSLLAAGGNLFASSGLYAAANTGSSENTFAPLNADGTVGSFAGATGSNTLLSAGGANLFNQAAISYIDANGEAHVMILGGDDVNDPSAKRAKVLFY
jgi:hypothetical protein